MKLICKIAKKLIYIRNEEIYGNLISNLPAGPTTTKCDSTMLGQDPVETGTIISVENLAGESPFEIFNNVGWTPTVPIDQVDLTPKDGVEITGVNSVTLDVTDVDKVFVIITKPDNSTEEVLYFIFSIDINTVTHFFFSLDLIFIIKSYRYEYIHGVSIL